MKNIRNFCIIAHIDHGKSTLADRLLEFTHSVEKRKMRAQLLDTMDLERERGITIKLQPVRMVYKPSVLSFSSKKNQKSKIKNQNDNKKLENLKIGNSLEIENRELKISDSEFILNLIDTPGHVDFSYEVSRSLAAVEGAILLVDATQGVQAQTLANLYLALEQNLEIIPVVNKIDLPNAQIEKTREEVCSLVGCEEDEVILASGKTGEGVEQILDAIVTHVPPPSGKVNNPLRALIFDSKYDSYKGVIAYVRVVDGEIRAENEIRMMSTNTRTRVMEVGGFFPELRKTDILRAGEIGYVATGFKDIRGCRVGDTVTKAKIKNLPVRQAGQKLKINQESVKKLTGYKEAKPMVFASFYPLEGDDYAEMRDALDKLRLNDASFVFEPETNEALGRGFRCGFLGVLHMEIVRERIKREFGIDPTITLPSVVYEVESKSETREKVFTPAQLPDPSTFETIYEPYVEMEIVTDTSHLGSVMELMRKRRAQYRTTNHISNSRVILVFDCPLSEVITDLHDELKSVSSGYASMSYELREYRQGDLVKLDVLVAGERVDALSRIVPRDQAYHEGKRTVERLKETIPRHNFTVALQAAVGGKIIARETIRPFRKDVTAKLYGGDVTRKRKLLEKQKKGKKRMRSGGSVKIPPEAFLAVLRK